MADHLRPEHTLLLRCTRVTLGAEDRQHIVRLVEQRLDWGWIATAAAEHGITPMLTRHLDAVCPGAVPAPVLDALRGESQRIAASNLHKVRELVEAMALFASEGIPAIPFKGPMVAVGVYGNLALRTFNDLDIVVPERHVAAALRLLLDSGYRPFHGLTMEQGRRTFEVQQHYPLVRERDDGFIELHWRFTSRHHAFRLDPDDAIARAGTLILGGRPVPTLSREDMLLVLCRHGANHRWADLELI